MKTVLFYDENVNIRGTSTTTYNYALYNEIYLGNKSIIGIPGGFGCNPSNRDGCSLEKYEERFPVYRIGDWNNIPVEHDYLYMQKNGYADNRLSSVAKNLVHVVFNPYEPHGDVYACISEWLSKKSGKNYPFVPYMVNLPDVTEDLKSELNIGKDKFVVGSYSGNCFFGMKYPINAVLDMVEKRSDIVFLFMNEDKFTDHERIIFLPASIDLKFKVKFINTCDVMLHARGEGETFGLAVGEFSSKNKPVITFPGNEDRAHTEILKDKAIIYNGYTDLMNILSDISKRDIDGKDWNAYRDYEPEKVMDIFNRVFL
jgi:hypothetical protein